MHEVFHLSPARIGRSLIHFFTPLVTIVQTNYITLGILRERKRLEYGA